MLVYFCSALIGLFLTTAPPIVFIRAETDNEAALIQSQVPTILALMKNLKSVKVVRTIEEVPAGCGSDVISSTIVAYILVRVRVRSGIRIFAVSGFPALIYYARTPLTSQCRRTCNQ